MTYIWNNFYAYFGFGINHEKRNTIHFFKKWNKSYCTKVILIFVKVNFVCTYANIKSSMFLRVGHLIPPLIENNKR